MYLRMSDLNELDNIRKIQTIENSMPDNFAQVGYDLRIENIFFIDESLDNLEKCKKLNKHDLEPGNTVFVSTIENVNMPNNLVGVIIQRNSLIRIGLRVEAPVYQPGHHTKIFLRVTNISQNPIELRENTAIASIMFEQLTGDCEPYKGSFVNEFKYSGLENYKNDLPSRIHINKKLQSIENIEKTIYEKIVTILSVFIGIFSLLNLNVNFSNKVTELSQMVVFNLVSIGIIGMLVGFIGFIIKGTGKHISAWIITIISTILLISACVLMRY